MVPRPRGRYKRHELDRAVRAVLDGEKGTIVAARAMIPYKTLMKTVREAKAGTIKAPLRRGPKPRLPPTCEADLVAWIVAMQQDGYPVDRQVIVVKANQLLRRLDPSLAVTAGWYRRFRARHLELANRVAQVISHARNAVTMDGVNLLFDSMVEIIKAHDLSPDRIFNMDETAFASRKKSKSVVALKGSQNVWAKTVASNFHLSIVACASASGVVLPPLFVFPGETVDKILNAECDVPNAAVSTSPKGFMNENLFKEWLSFFSSSLDESITRPVLLIFDGLASHYSSDILELCNALEIVLLCLPSNATHLFQPLDVSVFGPYKCSIRKAIFQSMVTDETGDFHSISKAAALRIASTSWTESVLPTNVISGFRATGLWPLSQEQMIKRYNLFKNCGVPKSYVEALWIERQLVSRSEVLRLPTKGKQITTRKRIDVGGRILTLALLKDMDKTKAERHEAAKRKNALLLKRGKRGSKLTMSPTGKKWARLAAKLGLVPLPNGETTRGVSNVEVVV
ncbi:hypothetical protein AaE_014334 [Aphanomyces astaci]|uniref:HTH CENPB-type domain-containing protein n=2 Tax=Aphanomyces astaci TaxID=112090 RepID=A0A6A4Z0J4_APHAT|nr:hypothetical protein AaE_014334 [Aphanomyces astaci]